MVTQLREFVLIDQEFLHHCFLIVYLQARALEHRFCIFGKLLTIVPSLSLSQVPLPMKFSFKLFLGVLVKQGYLLQLVTHKI